MQEIKAGKFTQERALFGAKELVLKDCIFDSGESALKHSERIVSHDCHFAWKYPFWYSKDIEVRRGIFGQTARAGMWYSQNLSFLDALFEAPKAFRRSAKISLLNVQFADASETLWHCKDVKGENVTAKGDYFALNCENLEFDGLNLVGNYCFDGCKNIHIKNSKLLSKDAFWNCENVLVENSTIIGEYLGWNSKNVTLVNCKIQSLQGMCYIENLLMGGCECIDTTLAFEYSSVDAEIKGEIASVKNPLGGRIKADKIGEAIMDKNLIDPSKTAIITG